MRVLHAQRYGLCSSCGGRIEPGMTIARRWPDPSWVHVTCLRKTHDGETQDGTTPELQRQYLVEQLLVPPLNSRRDRIRLTARQHRGAHPPDLVDQQLNRRREGRQRHRRWCGRRQLRWHRLRVAQLAVFHDQKDTRRPRPPPTCENPRISTLKKSAAVKSEKSESVPTCDDYAESRFHFLE